MVMPYQRSAAARSDIEGRGNRHLRACCPLLTLVSPSVVCDRTALPTYNSIAPTPCRPPGATASRLSAYNNAAVGIATSSRPSPAAAPRLIDYDNATPGSPTPCRGNGTTDKIRLHQMESPKRSTERTPFKDLSNSVNASVVDISNGGQPTDMKERKRQRARERYAQMDKQKKDELLRKRREAYQQKRARPLVSSEEAKVGASPSVLSQVQITTIGQGDIALNKENVVPNEDSEWLNRNDTYQRASIDLPSQGQENLMTDIIAINNCSNDGPTSSMIQPQPIDSKERKRLRDSERYALMDCKKKR
ncbi:uncharacterized protein LOC119360959 [Triticum dicoccoides]|uniref:uncharacterized protein LOC119360959 n=1 Tax=Triticum dicoccoides TaxID=85692 RepID=UPI00188DC91D|nr:uncharacterized protein LOC119360959 [Triticum dicoccoides]